jgi:hypothetical protein
MLPECLSEGSHVLTEQMVLLRQGLEIRTLIRGALAAKVLPKNRTDTGLRPSLRPHPDASLLCSPCYSYSYSYTSPLAR